MLEIPIGTVMSRIHRGRRLLRPHWRDTPRHGGSADRAGAGHALGGGRVMTCADRSRAGPISMASCLRRPRDLGEHLEQCDACRTELEARQVLRQTLRGAFLRSPSLGPAEASSPGRARRARREKRSRPAVGRVALARRRRRLLPWRDWPGWWTASRERRACRGHVASPPTRPATIGTARCTSPSRKSPSRSTSGALYGPGTGSPRGSRDGFADCGRSGATGRSARVCFAAGGLRTSSFVRAVASCRFSSRQLDRMALREAHRRVGVSRVGDLKVACTTAGGYAVFVISDMPDADNLALARLLVPAVRAHLAGA